MPPRVVHELLAIVVPPACAVCRAALPRAELWLCRSCTRALPWMPARTCPRCGLASHRRACPAANAAFARAWAPLAHQGVARELVTALKFRGALPVAAVMAAHVAANLPADLRELAPATLVPGDPSRRTAATLLPGDPSRRTATLVPGDPSRHPAAALVPVPAQRVRARRRGFDPAGALAAALAPRLGLPRRACLRRRDHAARQVGSTRAQRRRTGRLAIDLNGPPPALALLVDDVHTTGATLDACARALLAGGCEAVVALTYTRTL